MATNTNIKNIQSLKLVWTQNHIFRKGQGNWIIYYLCRPKLDGPDDLRFHAKVPSEVR